MENGTGKSSKCGNPVCCPLLLVIFVENSLTLHKGYGIMRL